MAWEVSGTDEFEQWFLALSDAESDAVEVRVDLLAEHGPSLKRPVVGEVKGSAFDPQMKELRISAGQAKLRVLFIFDPRREAVLLVGGDKQGNWNAWYREAVPKADRLYREWLAELGGGD